MYIVVTGPFSTSIVSSQNVIELTSRFDAFSILLRAVFDSWPDSACHQITECVSSKTVEDASVGIPGLTSGEQVVVVIRQ